MKNILTLVLHQVLLTIYSQNLKAQNTDCSVLPDPVQAIAASAPCFNVDSIFENCIPIYIKVNFHFFVNDDCSGDVSLPLDPTNVKQEDAAGWVNYIIYRANEDLANNMPQLNASGYNTSSSAPHCNPTRFITSGLYFHCNNTDKFDGYNLGLLKNNYAVNPNSELNVFMASFNHTSTSGAAFQGGSTSSINRFDWQVLNHELAHNLSLGHSFDPDGCDDTPILIFDYDRNCDGQISTNPDDKEKEQKCYGLEPSTSIKCNPPSPCPVYQCCDQGWINNNIMGYNSPNTAWTNCQINETLKHISKFKCEFIAQIGGNCPPVSAIITRQPKDIEKAKHCTYCFDLGASMGYNQYKIEIFDNLNPSSPSLIRSTNWLSGLARKYCIGGPLWGSWQDGMIPNHPYLIKLNVKNDCSETNKFFPFILPTRDCTIIGVPNEDKKLSLSPNPSSDNIIIHYELEEAAEVRILVTHQLYSSFNYTVTSLMTQNQGIYNVNVPIGSFYPGLNIIILQVDGMIFTETFIKQ
jgi:hypothetical protein